MANGYLDHDDADRWHRARAARAEAARVLALREKASDPLQRKHRRARALATATLLALSDSRICKAADWDESLHPRDETGRFAGGGGGGGGGGTPAYGVISEKPLPTEGGGKPQKLDDIYQKHGQGPKTIGPIKVEVYRQGEPKEDIAGAGTYFQGSRDDVIWAPVQPIKKYIVSAENAFIVRDHRAAYEHLFDKSITEEVSAAGYTDEAYRAVRQNIANELRAREHDAVVYTGMGMTPQISVINQATATIEEVPQPTPQPTATETTKPAAGGKKKVTLDEFKKDKVDIDPKLELDPKAAEEFLDNWDKTIGMDPGDFKKMYLGGAAGTMRVSFGQFAHGARTSIAGEFLDPNNESRSIGVYRLSFGKDKAQANLIELLKQAQGQGIAKKLLAGNVAFYKEKGIKQIDLHANIDVGGHAWARFGFVPEENSWDSLRNGIASKVARMASGKGGGARDWDSMSSREQSATEARWIGSHEDEFYESEISNWRDTGEPMNDAKIELAREFELGAPEWATEALSFVRQKRDEAGKPPIPYTDEQILAAVNLSYDPAYGAEHEGRADPDIEFDDDRLQEPENAPPKEQGTLPGIEPVDLSKHLTQDMRDDITQWLRDEFNERAESNVESIEPPDYLRESAQESASEYWDQMDDDERYNLAVSLDVIDEDAVSGTGQISDAEAEALQALTEDEDGKALWAVADSNYGKDLLLHSDWFGTLDMTDEETMERFNAYVAGQKAAKAKAA